MGAATAALARQNLKFDFAFDQSLAGVELPDGLQSSSLPTPWQRWFKFQLNFSRTALCGYQTTSPVALRVVDCMFFSNENPVRTYSQPSRCSSQIGWDFDQYVFLQISKHLATLFLFIYLVSFQITCYNNSAWKIRFLMEIMFWYIISWHVDVVDIGNIDFDIWLIFYRKFCQGIDRKCVVRKSLGDRSVCCLGRWDRKSVV